MNTSIYLPDELVEKIKGEIEGTDVSFSKFIRRVLSESLFGEVTHVKDEIPIYEKLDRIETKVDESKILNDKLDRLSLKLAELVTTQNSIDRLMMEHVFKKTDDEELEAANERLKKKQAEAQKKREIPSAAKTAADMQKALDEFSKLPEKPENDTPTANEVVLEAANNRLLEKRKEAGKPEKQFFNPQPKVQKKGKK